ncbi:MAG: hypothetical protein JWQ13_3488 [Ramlibacter sp.]|nr:hypothetical protein [Ramlibacter sp.]
MQDHLWVEPVSGFIMARLRGTPTEAMLNECEERVLMLVRDTGHAKVLYDALEMTSPTVEVALIQQKLIEKAPDAAPIRRAIVVPNTRIAYLSRIAFGAGDHRVFYNDLAAAIKWLDSADPRA